MRRPVLDCSIDAVGLVEACVVDDGVDVVLHVASDGIAYGGNLRHEIKQTVGNAKQTWRVDWERRRPVLRCQSRCGPVVVSDELVRKDVILEELCDEGQECRVFGRGLVNQALIGFQMISMVWVAFRIAFDHGLQDNAEHLAVSTIQDVFVLWTGTINLTREVFA